MNSSHSLKFSCHIFSNHLNFQLLSNLKFPTLLNFEPPTPLAACLFPPWLRCRPCGVAPKGPCGHGSGSWAPSQWRSSSMPWSAAGLRSTLHPFIFYHGWGKTIYSFLKMGGSFFFWRSMYYIGSWKRKQRNSKSSTNPHLGVPSSLLKVICLDDHPIILSHWLSTLVRMSLKWGYLMYVCICIYII